MPFPVSNLMANFYLLVCLVHFSMSSDSLNQLTWKMICIQNLILFVCNEHKVMIGAEGISNALRLQCLKPKDMPVNKILSINESSSFGNILIDR